MHKTGSLFSAHLKYLFLQSWTNIAETWWYFDTCFFCVLCLFVNFVLYLLIRFSGDRLWVLWERFKQRYRISCRLILLPSVIQWQYCQTLTEIRLISDANKNISNQNSTFLTWRPMHRGSWVVECGIFSIWLADLDQYKAHWKRKKEENNGDLFRIMLACC